MQMILSLGLLKDFKVFVDMGNFKAGDIVVCIQSGTTHIGEFSVIKDRIYRVNLATVFLGHSCVRLDETAEALWDSSRFRKIKRDYDFVEGVLEKVKPKELV